MSGDAPSLAGLPAVAALPLAVVRDGRASPLEASYRMEQGDRLELAVASDQEEHLADWLTTRAWSLESPPA